MKDVPLGDLVKMDEATGLKILPHWLAQPYFRPLPPSAGDKTKGASKKDSFMMRNTERVKGVRDVTNASTAKASHNPDDMNTIKRRHSPAPTVADAPEEVKRTKR